MLCSVLKLARRKWLEQERILEGTQDVVECFSLLLGCCSRFLKALQQNRARSRRLYLFGDKESVKFHTHYFIIFKAWRDSFSSVFYTFTKYAFSNNQSARYIFIIMHIKSVHLLLDYMLYTYRA